MSAGSLHQTSAFWVAKGCQEEAKRPLIVALFYHFTSFGFTGIKGRFTEELRAFYRLDMQYRKGLQNLYEWVRLPPPPRSSFPTEADTLASLVRFRA